MKPFLTYLACPYTHPDPAVRRARFEAANKATVALIRAFKWNVFSPITHSHPLHEGGLDGDWRFWEEMDTQYLEASVRMVILTVKGWTLSTGIRAEKAIADRLGLPIHFMSEPLITKRGPADWMLGASPFEPIPFDETVFNFSKDPTEVDPSLSHITTGFWHEPIRCLTPKRPAPFINP